MTLKHSRNNPYNVVSMFEDEIEEYTGAPYAIAVDSCTNALFLCMKYLGVGGQMVILPKKTYLSVPMMLIHAGGIPVFKDIEWSGMYQLEPLPLWDSAKRLTSGMYKNGQFICLSFHIKKQLGIGKGGMILTDDWEAKSWFKMARYEGRSEMNYKDDNIKMLGWNMYMTPQQAAHGLALIQNYPEHMPDLGENDGYKDLTENDIFKQYV